MEIKKIIIVAVLIFLFVSCNENQFDSPTDKKSIVIDTSNIYKSFKNDSIKEDVYEFAADYLMKRNLLEQSINELKKPVTLKKLKKLFFIIPLEKKSFDTVEVELYKFGSYSNEDADRVLIKKSTEPKFQVIGDSTSLHNAVMMERFFGQYGKFSDSIKARLYEYCINSYTYGKEYIE